MEEESRYVGGGLFSFYSFGEGIEEHTMTVPVLQGSFSFGGPPMQQLRRIDTGILNFSAGTEHGSTSPTRWHALRDGTSRIYWTAQELPDGEAGKGGRGRGEMSYTQRVPRQGTS